MKLAFLVLAAAITLFSTGGGAFAANSCGYTENTSGTTQNGTLQALCDLTTGKATKPASGAPTDRSLTLGTSSVEVVPAGNYVWVIIQNVSASANVACRIGGTPALNGAGSYMLAPMQAMTFESSFVPASAINCLASAAATPVTAGSF